MPFEKTAIPMLLAGAAVLMASGCVSSQMSKQALTRSGGSQTAPASSSAQRTTPTPVSYSITSISDIYSLWERNQVAAIDKYNDKPTQITGVVNGIYNDGAGRLEIEDRNDWSGLGITCNIDSSQRTALGQLSHGETVTIHGNLKLTNGMFDTREIEMRSCRIGAAQNIKKRARSYAPDLSATTSAINAPILPKEEESLAIDTVLLDSVQPGKGLFKSGRTGKIQQIGVSLTRRLNVNKHVIYDAKWVDGYESTYVFWDNGSVEVFSKDGNNNITNTAATFQPVNGGVLITAVTESQTYFPGLNPILN